MKVITGKIRMNYTNLFTPKAIENDIEAKYSLSILISKADIATIEKIEEAIKSAKTKGQEIWGDITPNNLKLPLRDGDIERADSKDYEDHYFINATSKYKPGIVDKRLNEITNEKEIYPGCYGRVSINFYPFNKNGQVGVGCGINNVQKISDGEIINISSKPEDDFTIIEDDFEELII
ncbi:MAG: DUF2815 family protein [Paraclostridium sp.]